MLWDWWDKFSYTLGVVTRGMATNVHKIEGTAFRTSTYAYLDFVGTMSLGLELF